LKGGFSYIVVYFFRPFLHM